MPSPNETQAVNLLRRQRTDPLRPEAQKAAKALVNRIQGVALAMTAQSVMRVAIAQHPEAGVFAAIERMAQDMERAQANDVTLKAIFDAAEASEEQRLAPFDAACTTRLEQIQDELEQAHRDHRSKILGQDRLERLWKSYTDKGLTRDEIRSWKSPNRYPAETLWLSATRGPPSWSKSPRH